MYSAFNVRKVVTFPFTQPPPLFEFWYLDPNIFFLSESTWQAFLWDILEGQPFFFSSMK